MHRIAKKLALKVTSRRQRHSCLILKGGRLIATGTNENGAHAEQNALSFYGPESLFQIDYTFKGATLISFRVAPNGFVGKSKPCVKCDIAIKETKIRKVIYYDGKQWVEEFR